MDYSKITYSNADRLPFSLSCLTCGKSTVIDIEDAIYDATSYSDVANRLNALHLSATVKLDKIRNDYVRYKTVDHFGNIKYLQIYA